MRRFILFLTMAAFFLTACGAQSNDSQQATATAYKSLEMIEAMEAAQAGAMALCQVDFDDDPQVYIDAICAESTDLACNLIGQEINASWAELQKTFSFSKFACAQNTSRLIEEGRQYGMRVQYWKVSLTGTQGYSDGNQDRDYWLQIADENGIWKLNRVLTSGEVSLYLSIENLMSEE